MKKKNKLTILGVNGWKKQGHDASACLVVDNKILSFVEEERFIRKRYAFDVLPIHAIRYCLESNNLTLADLDIIAFGWDKPALYKLAGLNYPFSSDKELLKELFPFNLSEIEAAKHLPKVEYVPHHIAHAASAFRVSGFSEASILVLDGQGEFGSGAMGYCDGDQIEFFETFPIEHSLGYFIEAACTFIGLKSSDAGKLMGLAAHGTPLYDFPEIVLTENGYIVEGLDAVSQKGELDKQKPIQAFWIDHFSKRFPHEKVQKKFTYSGTAGKVQEELILSQFSKDFAASAQRALEKVVLHLVSVLVQKTGHRKVAYSGGVALNCIANGRILTEKYADALYIQPAANDAGVSLGAALEVAHQNGRANFPIMDHSYWGVGYSDEEIKKELQRLKIPHTLVSDIARKTAQAIADGKIVGWFQEKMEIGPRALGARSIVANPAIAEMHRTLNIIKSREQWRPLAPSVIGDRAGEYFEDACDSPFMLLTHYVKKSKRKEVPAIVHVDGTARYQSVYKHNSPLYYRLIEEFEKLTGIPIILDTSFNIGGDPIVTTPEQAIKTLYSSEIDCLAIGSYWVEKENKK